MSAWTSHPTPLSAWTSHPRRPLARFGAETEDGGSGYAEHPGVDHYGREFEDNRPCYRERYPGKGNPGGSSEADMRAWYEKNGIKLGHTYGCSLELTQRVAAAALRNPRSAFSVGSNAILPLRLMFKGTPDFELGDDVDWRGLVERPDKPLAGVPCDAGTPDQPNCGPTHGTRTEQVSGRSVNKTIEAYINLAPHLLKLAAWERRRGNYAPPFITLQLDVHSKGIMANDQLEWWYFSKRDPWNRAWRINRHFRDYVPVGDVWTFNEWEQIVGRRLLYVHRSVCRVVRPRRVARHTPSEQSRNTPERGWVEYYEPHPDDYDPAVYTPLGLSLDPNRCVVVLKCFLRMHRKAVGYHCRMNDWVNKEDQRLGTVWSYMHETVPGCRNASLVSRNNNGAGPNSEIELTPILSYREALKNVIDHIMRKSGTDLDDAVWQGWVDGQSRRFQDLRAYRFMYNVCLASNGQPEVDGYDSTLCACLDPRERARYKELEKDWPAEARNKLRVECHSLMCTDPALDGAVFRFNTKNVDLEDCGNLVLNVCQQQLNINAEQVEVSDVTLQCNVQAEGTGSVTYTAPPPPPPQTTNNVPSTTETLAPPPVVTTPPVAEPVAQPHQPTPEIDISSANEAMRAAEAQREAETRAAARAEAERESERLADEAAQIRLAEQAEVARQAEAEARRKIEAERAAEAARQAEMQRQVDLASTEQARREAEARLERERRDAEIREQTRRDEEARRAAEQAAREQELLRQQEAAAQRERERVAEARAEAERVRVAEARAEAERQALLDARRRAEAQAQAEAMAQQANNTPATPPPAQNDSGNEDAAAAETGTNAMKRDIYILAGVGGVLVIAFIIGIVVALKRRNRNSESS